MNEAFAKGESSSIPSDDGKYLPQRTKMMQLWADYLEQAQKQRPHKKATPSLLLLSIQG